MATVLCISSQVARGYVGGSAQRIALERLGHQVWLLPTIMLSNHPGHAHFTGQTTPPETIVQMAQALGDNGWLDEIDAVLTGYMPSAEHVAAASGVLDLVRGTARRALYLCDPAFGDDQRGVYVDEGAAQAIKQYLAGRSDLATPNRFELEWLTGRTIGDEAEALEAARALARPRVLVTSAPASDGSIGNLLLVGDRAWRSIVAQRENVPHGTGDLMAALLIGHLMADREPQDALALATTGVDVALAHSTGADELQLSETQPSWSAPRPWPVSKIEGH